MTNALHKHYEQLKYVDN